MAIFVEGMQCSLCGKPMTLDQELVGFPPFIPNTLDPLYFINDATLHAHCFYNHPLATKSLERLREGRKTSNHICAVCGQKIDHPDDYFLLGHLTDEPTHPLYAYNYLQFHKSHLPNWDHLLKAYELLMELKHSGTWGGKSLDWMLQHLESALRSQKDNSD